MKISKKFIPFFVEWLTANFNKSTYYANFKTDYLVPKQLPYLETCLKASTITGAKSFVNSGPFLLLF